MKISKMKTILALVFALFVIGTAGAEMFARYRRWVLKRIPATKSIAWTRGNSLSLVPKGTT